MKTTVIADSSTLSTGIIDATLPHGYETVQCRNGIDTILKVYETIPCCIILREELEGLSGIQTASVLKSLRGISAIPRILLHDPKEKPAVPADLFDQVIPFDPDTTDMAELISSLADRTIDHEAIAATASEVTREAVMTRVISHLDDMLKTGNRITRISSITQDTLTAPHEMIRRTLELIVDYTQVNIAIILTEEWKRPRAYIYVDEQVLRGDLDEFMSVCLNDFYTRFDSLNLEDVDETVFNVETRKDFEKIRIDSKSISSYTFHELRNTQGEITGTIHFGSLTNNFFSETVLERINYYLPIMGPALHNSLEYAVTQATGEKLRKVFAKFIPEEIIQSLIEKDSDEELMVGEKRNIVVLFSDIRSFTTISESNKPEDVVRFLNQYFDLQVSIIKKHGGSIDKFIGDAIFAIFGAPISYEDNAERAVRAAMEMIEALAQIDVSHLVIPGDTLRIGIGLHEGDAIVGNIGSSTKFDYTAIGDTVNLAARLEGYTKYYHREILMSEQVYRKIASHYPVREVDYVKVKGKDIATSLFTVEFDERIHNSDYLHTYHKAYKMYKLGNFTTALEYYKSLKEENPDDAIVDLFMERCQQFIENPPQEWDGSLALGFK